MYLTYTSRMMECRRDGYEEGLHTGREEGISIGMERGAYEKALETAQLMIGLGIPLEQVQLCTNLPLDVVQGLIQVP